jgi:hypothetical protein
MRVILYFLLLTSFSCVNKPNKNDDALLQQRKELTIEQHIERFKSPIEKVRIKSLRKVISFEGPSISPIIRYYKMQKDDYEREDYFDDEYLHDYLMSALYHIGNNGISALVKELSLSDLQQTTQILSTLGYIGSDKAILEILAYINSNKDNPKKRSEIGSALYALAFTQSSLGLETLTGLASNTVYLSKKFNGLILPVSTAFVQIGDKKAIQTLNAIMVHLNNFEKKEIKKKINLLEKSKKYDHLSRRSFSLVSLP